MTYVPLSPEEAYIVEAMRKHSEVFGTLEDAERLAQEFLIDLRAGAFRLKQTVMEMMRTPQQNLALAVDVYIFQKRLRDDRLYLRDLGERLGRNDPQAIATVTAKYKRETIEEIEKRHELERERENKKRLALCEKYGIKI